MIRTLCVSGLAVLAVACGSEAPPESSTPVAQATTAGSEASPTNDADSSGLIQETPEAPSGQSKKVSPWGSPETERGEPLPERKRLSAPAQRALEQGLAAMSVFEDERAARLFRQALDEDARAYQAAYHLGVLADRAGNSTRALEHYQQALRIQPDYERAAAGIVAVHARLGSLDEALRIVGELAQRWERNLRLQVVYSEALVQGKQFDKAEAIAIAALRRDERYVPAMLAIARASMARGRSELAESILEQALGIDPKQPEALYLRGTLLLIRGQLPEAMDHYKRAIEARPDYAEAHVALGIQLLSGGNYAEALKHLTIASRLMPPQAEMLLDLGDAYRANREWEKALQTLEKALSLEPNLAEAHFNLGLLYMSVGSALKGLTTLQALQKAVEEFGAYRALRGGKLAKNDLSRSYLEDLDRQIQREKRRLEREARNAATKKEEP
ncbi:MAG: tetratricopeptide repeat protein [Myxococcales bacterium]|nr:tetratricopeptide repeat protein [Myxococcales bacterium]MCB9708785.1 tetratricopeptide repeat protein [Myxococcales bacterium]